MVCNAIPATSSVWPIGSENSGRMKVGFKISMTVTMMGGMPNQ